MFIKSLPHRKMMMPVNQNGRMFKTHRSAEAVAICMLLSKRVCIIVSLCDGFESHSRIRDSSVGRAKHLRRFESCSVLKTDSSVAEHYNHNVAKWKLSTSLKLAKQRRPALTTKEFSDQVIKQSPLVNSGKAGEPPAG